MEKFFPVHEGLTRNPRKKPVLPRGVWDFSGCLQTLVETLALSARTLKFSKNVLD
ncbi:MAG: hypothetical protein CM1200mP39_14270 [Dehalococcoidia bacterium]|nr:MAG: hypothetical protein CM1200mP39_14270 [Dehalococcoidia bacterium]